MRDYPKRSSHFAHKYTRALFGTCAADDIGLDGIALCVHIAHLEDSRHYQGPVKLWNAHLETALGASTSKIRRIRDKCVEAGWLHYERGSNRAIGFYWATLPRGISDSKSSFADEASEIDDLLEQEGGDDTINATGIASDLKHEPAESCDMNQPNVDAPSNPSPNPIPVSSCPGKSPDVKSDEKPESPKRPKYKFAERDMACAKWMWGLILDLQPSRKPPNLESWANCIRLIRECDKRSYEDISALFRWVNADPFWQTNVLSPDKLRSQWDNLQLKRRASLARAGPCGKPRETVDSLYPPIQRP